MQMPQVVQHPTPNYTPVAISHDLLILHMMEGGYLGSVSWLCIPKARASAHLCMSEDGSIVSQLVPLQYKAWAECEFNSKGISLEIPGHTADGIPDDRWRAAAKIFAWLSLAYNIPPVWAKGGQGRGICQHHDLGAAGGGHVDCSLVGSKEWLTFIDYVVDAQKLFDPNDLPLFALHGLPNPHTVSLPPDVIPVPSHGGSPRVNPNETPVPHFTASGYPLGSMFDWQYRLIRVGANPQLMIDGNETAATKRAIGVFQKAVGIKVTDDVNPETWSKLVEMT
jgi:peptidoglycan hydrolase-like protein with peptidoglycan-binding domain